MTSAKELKDQGNQYFQCHRFEEAVNCYTKAIIKNPQCATYFTNRALCFINLKVFDKAVTDCRKALEMDRKLLKAHFFLGKALLQLGELEESIICLSRALELSRTQQSQSNSNEVKISCFGDEITRSLREARRFKFTRDDNVRLQQEIELQSYLRGLIEKDKERQIDQLVQSSSNCDMDTDAQRQANSNRDSNMDTDVDVQTITELSDSRLAQLEDLFKQVDERRQAREVPDYLCGRISFEVLKDPVITPSGITYDRKDILEHLRRVGHFDPVTRQTLTEQQLIPNLAMKEVVDHFLERNEWAILEY